jgi:zinc transporter ZupT
MLSSPLAVGGIIFALSLAAGLLALGIGLSERWLHRVVAAACGLFLGITFLHLLPELSARASAPDGSSLKLWGSVLAGLLAVFVADVLLRAREGEQGDHPGGDHPAHHGGHRVVGIATFVGLSVHTFAGAVGIGVGFDIAALREAFVAATLSHKAAEAFSLASVLRLAELKRRSIVLLLIAYSLVTPVGIAAGRLFAHGFHWMPGPAEGLAAGTFLYVAVGELLPEVFHGRADRGMKVLLVLLGIAASTALLAAPEAGIP